MKRYFPTEIILICLLLPIVEVSAQVDFWSISGQSVEVTAVVDGYDVADRLGSNDYNGYVGELVIAPTDPSLLGGLPASTLGIIETSSGGAYDSVRGLVGFCIDSETGFQTSSGLLDSKSYMALNYEEANSRYIEDGVSQYRPGSLLRAAYLIDRFYEEVHAGGDLEAAALQTAIWEVMYDATPNVGTGIGNYYVRNNTRNGTLNARSNEIIAQTTLWFNEAEADNWGGAGYDPSNRVIFWVDPNNANNNQSIITLNPGNSITTVPEMDTVVLSVIGIPLLLIRRRA